MSKEQEELMLKIEKVLDYLYCHVSLFSHNGEELVVKKLSDIDTGAHLVGDIRSSLLKMWGIIDE